MMVISSPRLDGADGRFAAATGAVHADFDLAEAVAHRLAAGILRDHLRGVRGALARALEANLAGAAPAEHVARWSVMVTIGVVESREDVRDADRTFLLPLALTTLIGSMPAFRSSEDPAAAGAAPPRQCAAAPAARFLGLLGARRLSSERSLGLAAERRRTRGAAGCGRRSGVAGCVSFVSHNVIRSKLRFRRGGCVLRALDADGLTRALAGAGVGLGALAADREAATVADATIAVDRLETLEVLLRSRRRSPSIKIFCAEMA
jgi:hypothetical protein